ncbi:MAG: glycosyl transferase, partial [Cyclobacteriaceae bacterium]
MKIKKILVIRFSSIGDIVLTSPVVRNLKTQLPDAEVHYCTKKSFHPILKANPYIDKIHLLDKDLSALIGDLQREGYDYIVDLHNNLRTRIIKTKLKAKSASFNKLNLEKWLMVNLKINKLPNVHIVDRYMETVGPLSIKMDSLGLDYFIPDNENVDISSLPQPFQKEYVAFAIG